MFESHAVFGIANHPQPSLLVLPPNLLPAVAIGSYAKSVAARPYVIR